MEKEYRIKWQTPVRSGELTVKTTNFAKIPELVFHFFNGRPPGCPFLITRVELLNPTAYLNVKGVFN